MISGEMIASAIVTPESWLRRLARYGVGGDFRYVANGYWYHGGLQFTSVIQWFLMIWRLLMHGPDSWLREEWEESTHRIFPLEAKGNIGTVLQFRRSLPVIKNDCWEDDPHHGLTLNPTLVGMQEWSATDLLLRSKGYLEACVDI